ncbi:MAG: hypothetical protein ABIL58_06605 [Pseudomonadota bacterium]
MDMPAHSIQESVATDFDNDDHFIDNTRGKYKAKADAVCPSNNQFIEFAGYKWWINYHWSLNQGTYAWEPFRSNFDPHVIKRTPDGVQLNIIPGDKSQDDSRTSEIVLSEVLGYGTYLVTARADGDSFQKLDPNAVFGIFTYQYSEGPPADGINRHRELDALEVIYRGKPGDAQFTLQPWTYDLNIKPGYFFDIPPDAKYLTSTMNWQGDGSLAYSLYNGDYSYNDIMSNPTIKPFAIWKPSEDPVLRKYIAKHTPLSRERFHVNLWLMHGNRPAAPQTVTVTRFQFIQPGTD